MARIELNINKNQIRELILAHNAIDHIKEVMAELYTGIKKEPCENTLFSSLSLSNEQMIVSLFRLNDKPVEEVMTFLDYLKNDSIDIETKVEKLYTELTMEQINESTD